LPNIDSIIDGIRKNSKVIDVNAMLRLAIRIVINTLRNAILSENTEKFRKALEVVSIDANIELEKEIYTVFSKNPLVKNGVHRLS